MERRTSRRRRGLPLALEPLEGRQLLSAARTLPPGAAAEIASQSLRNARPAPQSPSPHTTRVSVSADRPIVPSGEPVRLTITQAVAGQTPVNTGPMGNYDVVISRRGRELWRYSDDRGPILTSHVLVTLQPGESRQATVTWDGRSRDGSIVTGPVEIRAEVDRVSSPPITIQLAGPSTPSPTSPRNSLVPRSPSGRGASQPRAAANRAEQLRQRQALQAAEARRLSFDQRPARPSRSPLDRPFRWRG
ncbi:BsuPI-related putative proteinase inhibitor [Tautonia sociabilis]|uniref:Intracellular proteinase inhibitor BsuPI domain-containing protein n=1 Tax=Tautonia sociabilis TaxID=2080755 RepID=A0A432MP74_9BACT|nr:hypothetical protein [Tautonia sociabilis]RUL89253.1 hypothetical protein TsocGM_02200 [Tautonia sociabilis]